MRVEAHTGVAETGWVAVGRESHHSSIINTGIANDIRPVSISAEVPDTNHVNAAMYFFLWMCRLSIQISKT